MSDIQNTELSAGSNPFTASSRSQMATVQVEQERAVAEVQAAMILARRFPRDQMKAMDNILNACTRPKLAEGALYNYSRGGTDISGPSIRLAEALATAWGNIQFGIRELEQRDGESTVEAYAWDIETNTRQSKVFQVPHTRHSKRGVTKLTDPRDVYETVANNGARRLRACILGVIPGDVVEEAVKQCEVTMQANADTSPEAMQKMLKAFLDGFGISKEQIEKRIQRRIDAIQPAQVVALRKIYASLKDGMSAPSDWFEGVSMESPDKPEIGKPAQKAAAAFTEAAVSHLMGPSDDEKRKKIIDAVNEARDAANLTMSDFKAKAVELGIAQKGEVLPNYTMEQLAKVKEQWANFSVNPWQE